MIVPCRSKAVLTNGKGFLRGIDEGALIDKLRWHSNFCVNGTVCMSLNRLILNVRAERMSEIIGMERMPGYTRNDVLCWKLGPKGPAHGRDGRLLIP